MTIEYNPVAGLTIEEALKRAISIARERRQHVLVMMNDIAVVVNKDTDVKMALKKYREKVDLKYEIIFKRNKYYTERMKKTLKR